MSQIDQYRRNLLGAASAAFVGLNVAPGVLLQTAQAKSDEEAVSSKQRWGLLIDTNLCEPGCTDCVKACNEEHGLREIHERSGQRVRMLVEHAERNGLFHSSGCA